MLRCLEKYGPQLDEVPGLKSHCNARLMGDVPVLVSVHQLAKREEVYDKPTLRGIIVGKKHDDSSSQQTCGVAIILTIESLKIARKQGGSVLGIKGERARLFLRSHIGN